MQRDIILDHRGLADHDPGAMIKHQPPAQPGIRMDIHPEHLGHPALQEPRRMLPAMAPQVMRHPMGLDGVIALEIQERRQQVGAGWIALADRHQVLGCGRGNLRTILHRLHQ